jgi:uncharacterized protein YjbJ (UPF0337 family)
MNEDRIAGTAKNIGGKVEEGLGRVTGDLKTQVEGAAQQIAGSAQDLYGQAKDRAADAAQAVREKSGGCRGLCAQEHREPALHRSRHCTRRRFPDRTNGTPRLLVTAVNARGGQGLAATRQAQYADRRAQPQAQASGGGDPQLGYRTNR